LFDERPQLNDFMIYELGMYAMNIKTLTMFKVAGHIPAQVSDVPSWDAETIFFL
jgi:hypothetical protein